MNYKDASIYDRVLTLVTNFSTAIDVGAYRGEWTEKMARDFSKVYCFEPNNILCYRLVDRFCDELPHVILYNIGLLDFHGSGKLCYDEKNVKKDRARFVVPDDEGDIEVSTLDSLRIQRCGLLKVDVEGGELPVLRGAENILRQQKPVVVVECKAKTSPRYGWTRSDLYAYMRTLGYRLAFENKPNLVFV